MRLAREHIVTAEGGFFHVLNRVAGSPRYFPFREPRVRRRFSRWLRYCLGISCIECASHMLMGNHYHLVVRVPEFRELSRTKLEEYARARWGRLWGWKTRGWSEERWLQLNRDLFCLHVFMRDFQGPFASWFNRHFDRRGHFWGDRYRCIKLEDSQAVQECIYYLELNPVRAGLCKRPEEWKESSAYLRWLGHDGGLMDLGEIFPEISRNRLFAHYRAGLLYRGLTPLQAKQQALDPEVVRIEQARGFSRPGLYLERLHFLSHGLVLGTADHIRDHLDRLRIRGVYKRPREPIPQLEGLFFTLARQRFNARSRATPA